MTAKTRVMIWNEFRHEKTKANVQKHYPAGMHVVMADFLREQGFEVQTATLDEAEHGLTEEILNHTDVLTWWGHGAHAEVQDAIVDRVQQRVLDGMGLIVLHSGHYSKIFKRLMGTRCDLKWREANERERLWVAIPGHPIAEGLGAYIELPGAEMYGEPFGVPNPDEVVFISWFEGGEVFRSGLCYTRGRGRIFYFRPGHETFPIYHQPDIQRVIGNAVRWAAPIAGATIPEGEHRPQSLEKIEAKDE